MLLNEVVTHSVNSILV